MKNIPEKIYLNIGEDLPAYADFRGLSEVTWSEEKVTDADIPYAHKSEWTSVADALPETDDDVLVFIPCLPDFGELDRYEVAYYNGEDWYTSDGEHVHPAYWMEIPAIPEEEER